MSARLTPAQRATLAYLAKYGRVLANKRTVRALRDRGLLVFSEIAIDYYEITDAGRAALEQS